MSLVVEEVATEEDVYLDMDKVKEEDLDTDEVKDEDFGYVQYRGGGCSRGGRGGRGSGHEGRGNQNSYNNNGRKNHNHRVDKSDLTRKFTIEEVSALIQANVWDNICAEQRTNRKRLNNNDDGDIRARVNDLVSTIKTLQDTVSQITDNQTDNGGYNNSSGGNKMVEKCTEWKWRRK